MGERMRLGIFALLALVFSGSIWAGFTFLYELNGSSQENPSDESLLFATPSGVFHSGGKLYVSDSGKGALYVFNGTKRVNVMVSLGGSALTGPLRMGQDPQDAQQTIYIADGNSGRIKTYAGSGSEIDVWNPSSNMERPSGIAFDSQNAYIADMVGGRVYAYSKSTKAFSKIAVERGESDGLLSSPADIEKYGDLFFVSDSGKGLVFVYDSNFTYKYAIGRGKGGVVLKSPRGIHAHDGMLFVADATGNRIVVYTLTGYPIDSLGSANLSYPEDVFVSGSTAYVADSFNRKVRIYNFSKPEGNQETLGLIKAANQSVQELYELRKIAQKLGLAEAGSSHEGKLEEALEEYRNYQFTAASKIAERAKEEAENEKKEIRQSASVRIKQLVKQAKDYLAPARKKAENEPSLAALLSDFDRKSADAEAKLSAGNYMQSAELALSLSPMAESIRKKAEELESSQASALRNQTQASLLMELEGMSARISALQAKAEKYRQDINLTNAQRLVRLANSSILAGDSEAAGSSLRLAEVDVRVNEGMLEKRVLEIESALANLTAFETMLNASAAKPVLLPPDFKQERELIAQARESVYGNPQMAVQMGKKAAEDAEGKAKDAQRISVAAAALLVMFGMIAALFIAFFLHIRGKRRGRL
ncbi:MAG: NHL repeat-containing protein [Candidatus Micrarchaeota archaeon]|nr:NHL repeat-containing protein [Candidatus Micrarchaeota archaeon]